jgi:serine protease Do
MNGFLRYTPRILLILGIAVLAGCVSIGSEPSGPALDRRDLLVEHVEEQLAQGATGVAVDRVSYGLDRGLLDRAAAQSVLDRVTAITRERYHLAIRSGEYRDALQARRNLEVLADNPLNLDSTVELDDIDPRDNLLLQWADRELRRGEPVLALYLLLRRSTVEDLDEDTAHKYVAVAEDFNNDEAVRRLARAIGEAPGRNDPETDDAPDTRPGTADLLAERSPTDMLPGTVTVWVNRGIRIRDGVGVPDRVIGSGFFVDPRGYLLTNYHVIASEVDPTYNGYSRLSVKLAGRPNERIPARVVGYDRVFDLALVKVEIDAPFVFSLSDTRRLRPGERVLALGSPGGLDSTITAGIVSAEGRRFLQMGEAVQIDAPVNPGNSGGALVLPDGQVAGIVFAGIPQFEGVNFAIPSYWVRHFFPRLFDGGEVVHPWLGAAVHTGRDGLSVVYVAPGSPADRAGVIAGDRLRSIDGHDVSDLAGAQDLIMERAPGDLIRTDWDSTEKTETITRLMAVSERPFSPVEEALKSQPIEALFPVLFGMDVDEISGPPWGPDFVITNVLPGSIADESSLSPNDPFSLRSWRVDTDLRAAFIQIIIRQRKAGFLESGLQLGAFLETDSFL